MLVNEFTRRTYSCASSITDANGCSCSFQSSLANKCQIAGEAVLDFYDYSPGQLGETVGIMISIIVVYRLLGLLALYLRK